MKWISCFYVEMGVSDVSKRFFSLRNTQLGEVVLFMIDYCIYSGSLQYKIKWNGDIAFSIVQLKQLQGFQ